MKKNLLILIIPLFLTGCEKHHAAMPPGFTVACDGAGHYGCNWGGYYMTGDYSGRPMTTRQQAIDRAWDQYEYNQSAKAEEDRQSRYQAKWHDCDN